MDVTTGVVSQRYLALDQGMIMAALGNALLHDSVRRYFVRDDMKWAIRPLLAVEKFNAAQGSGSVRR